jgi:hypothetical protein
MLRGGSAAGETRMVVPQYPRSTFLDGDGWGLPFSIPCHWADLFVK